MLRAVVVAAAAASFRDAAGRAGVVSPNVVEGAPKVPGLERIVSLERAASLHLDTLATLASKGSPLQPSVTPDTVAQHFSEPIAAERAVAV